MKGMYMLNVNQLGNSPVQQPNFKGKKGEIDRLYSEMKDIGLNVTKDSSSRLTIELPFDMKPVVPKHQLTEAERKEYHKFQIRQTENFLKPFADAYKMEKEAPEKVAKKALKYRKKLFKEPNVFEKNITKFLLWLMSFKK